MKTKILFLIIAFSGMLFLSGCEDTLDVTENFIYELEVKVFSEDHTFSHAVLVDMKNEQDLIKKYGVDFVLLDRGAFIPEYIEQDSWRRGIEPAATAAITQLKQGIVPALSKVVDSCSVLQTKDGNNSTLIVLSADCLLTADVLN